MFDCKKLTGNKAGKNDVRLQSVRVSSACHWLHSFDYSDK